MNTETKQVGHTPGEWTWTDQNNDRYIDIDCDGNRVCSMDLNALNEAGVSDEECKANARLIAAAPALFQMVKDLKNCVKRLSQDDLTQFDRDKEAQWEGEAHELLLKINPNFYKNANE